MTEVEDTEHFKQYKEFRESLGHFLEFWREKEDFDSSMMIPALIAEVKIEACFHFHTYCEMLGGLVSVINEDLELMFDDIQKVKEEEEEDEEQDCEDENG